jgi:hypothetical protein
MKKCSRRVSPTKKARRAMSRPFPVSNPPAGAPAFVRWESLCDKHARAQHGVGLERLAHEGGLSAYHLTLNIKRLPRFAAAHDAVDVLLEHAA